MLCLVLVHPGCCSIKEKGECNLKATLWIWQNICVCHRCSAAYSSALTFPLETQLVDPPHSSLDAGVNGPRFAWSHADTHQAFQDTDGATVRQAEMASKPVHLNQIVPTCSISGRSHLDADFLHLFTRRLCYMCTSLLVANQCQLHVGWCQDSRLGKNRKRTSAAAEPDESPCIPRVIGPRGISCSQRLDGKGVQVRSAVSLIIRGPRPASTQQAEAA